MRAKNLRVTDPKRVSIHAPRCREAMPSEISCLSLASRFNPRPPLPGGDADEHAQRIVKLAVSIHAPLRLTAAQMFQSTPPVAGRRCADDQRRYRLVRRFQSTPPVAGRRCHRRLQCLRPMSCFNPRPPLPGGDARDYVARVSGRVVSIHAPRCREAMLQLPILMALAGAVSIHAPRCREAMHREVIAMLTAYKFQSTPPVAGRRCVGQEADGEGAGVSIHAPRCREAMLAVGCRHQTATEFQSTPPVAGRRCGAFQPLLTALLQFQSTPPVAGRRCDAIDLGRRGRGGFNPRPPLPGGDALRPRSLRRQGQVSIHAPRCREAMPPIALTCSRPAKFQSTPPVAGRRCFRKPCGWPVVPSVSIHAPRCREAMLRAQPWRALRRRCFNPRPPLPGGDAWRDPAGRRRRYCFNPRPPLPGGDAQGAKVFRVGWVGFNPRPPLPGGDADK
ncbi:MAG: hypothetical protein FD131_2867 [Rhodocyclaceae bacterium]|nr:MAG: hypothetical protein FD131_2867 [Rhodocyclaceae bacterium]